MISVEASCHTLLAVTKPLHTLHYVFASKQHLTPSPASYRFSFCGSCVQHCANVAGIVRPSDVQPPLSFGRDPVEADESCRTIIGTAKDETSCEQESESCSHCGTSQYSSSASHVSLDEPLALSNPCMEEELLLISWNGCLQKS